MYKAQTITQVITMIVAFLCCLLIADAQSATEEKTTEEKNTGKSKQDSGEGKSTEDPKQGAEKKRTFDFFTRGSALEHALRI